MSASGNKRPLSTLEEYCHRMAMDYAFPPAEPECSHIPHVLKDALRAALPDINTRHKHLKEGVDSEKFILDIEEAASDVSKKPAAKIAHRLTLDAQLKALPQDGFIPTVNGTSHPAELFTTRYKDVGPEAFLKHLKDTNAGILPPSGRCAIEQAYEMGVVHDKPFPEMLDGRLKVLGVEKTPRKLYTDLAKAHEEGNGQERLAQLQKKYKGKIEKFQDGENSKNTDRFSEEKMKELDRRNNAVADRAAGKLATNATETAAESSKNWKFLEGQFWKQEEALGRKATVIAGGVAFAAAAVYAGQKLLGSDEAKKPEPKAWETRVQEPQQAQVAAR